MRPWCAGQTGPWPSDESQPRGARRRNPRRVSTTSSEADGGHSRPGDLERCMRLALVSTSSLGQVLSRSGHSPTLGAASAPRTSIGHRVDTLVRESASTDRLTCHPNPACLADARAALMTSLRSPSKSARRPCPLYARIGATPDPSRSAVAPPLRVAHGCHKSAERARFHPPARSFRIEPSSTMLPGVVLDTATMNGL